MISNIKDIIRSVDFNIDILSNKFAILTYFVKVITLNAYNKKKKLWLTILNIFLTTMSTTSIRNFVLNSKIFLSTLQKIY